MKIIDFLYTREVGLELIKTILTFIFGYITFKVYQLYKNKKDNSTLYVKIIKLEKELNDN